MTMPGVPTLKEFQDDVAEAFRLMGYRVRKSSATNIDLQLEYTLPDGVVVRTGVIWIYIPEGLVSKPLLLKYLDQLESLRSARYITHAAIVTTHGFSREACSSAAEVGIQLATLAELHQRIL